MLRGIKAQLADSSQRSGVSLADAWHVPHASHRWWQWTLLVLSFLWCAVCFSWQPADPDLWGHVRYGLDWLDYGLDREATYTYTAQGHRWINHENLSEITTALVAELAGAQGLVLAKTLLGLVVFGLIVLRARQQHLHAETICVVAVLFSVNTMSGWTVRPQLASYLCCAVMLWVLGWVFAPWEDRQPARPGLGADQNLRELRPRLKFLWCLLPVFVLWTNAHGGFVAGVALLLAYLGLRCAEIWYVGGRQRWHVITIIASVMIAVPLATLVNPYGWEFHQWLWTNLNRPLPEISEWQSLEWGEPRAWNFMLLGLVTVAANLLSGKRIDLTHLFVFGLTTWQSALHRRHIVFMGLLFSFWFARHIDGFLFPKSSEPGAATRPLRGWTYRMTAAGVLGSLLLMSLVPQLRGIQVSPTLFPVEALKFMAAHDLTHGRIIANFGWAQYVLGAFGHRDSADQGLLMAYDGRWDTCYPKTALDWGFDFEVGDTIERYRSALSGEMDPGRALREGSPDLVLVDRREYGAQHLRSVEAEWVILYQDGLAELWGRRTVFDDPEQPRYLPPTQREFSEKQAVGLVTWPAFPNNAWFRRKDP